METPYYTYAQNTLMYNESVTLSSVVATVACINMSIYNNICSLLHQAVKANVVEILTLYL